jgi:hypothetical protein
MLTFVFAGLSWPPLCLIVPLQVMMTAIDSITPSNYVFQYLEVEALEMQQMNLQLGFPAHITHIIKPGSPLYNLSLQVGHGAYIIHHDSVCPGTGQPCSACLLTAVQSPQQEC